MHTSTLHAYMYVTYALKNKQTKPLVTVYEGRENAENKFVFAHGDKIKTTQGC